MAEANINPTELQIKCANLFNGHTEALNDVIANVSVIVKNSSVPISSLNLAHQELRAQYDAYIDAWYQYEKQILIDTSLHLSAGRDFRGLKRQGFNILNEISELQDEISSVTVPIPTPLPNHTHSLPTPKITTDQKKGKVEAYE